MSGSSANEISANLSEVLYISDPHGEFDEFSHIVRSGCGAVRRIVDSAFSGTLDERKRAELATLIEYPTEKLASIIANADALLANTEALLNELAEACGGVDIASPYAEGEATLEIRKQRVVALCNAIRRRVVAHVHMLGDVYDRGPAPELIMDELEKFEHVDIQWGNHDIVWMGAALGQDGCIGHVVRNCARYANLSVLEDAYGIDLSPLKAFALSAYKDDPCAGFALKGTYPELSADELDMNVKVQKAMAIIQFKVEGQLIDKNPSFGLADRKLLDKMDLANGTVVVDGETYDLTDTVLPTVDFEHPYELTAQEAEVMASLQNGFRSSERLQRHIACLLEKGGMYKIAGDKLLLHACVPLNNDGSLKEVELFGERYKGKALYDAVDKLVREAFAATGSQDQEFGQDLSNRGTFNAPEINSQSQKAGQDLLWYLWLGAGSPVFAKSKMATFEIYFIADKAARKEVKNAFYTLYENEEVMANIFEDFGMDPAKSRIVCGHTPVKVKDGESPVKCGGRVLVIDGGMSAAYQKTTGIAGFALVEKAASLELYSFEPFVGHRDAIANNAELSFSMQSISAL